MRRFADLAKLNKMQALDQTAEIVHTPSIQLTSEQQRVIEELNKGNSVVVDSCIGAGKTMVIQELCNHFSNKRILYLTYNRLLKLDAQGKIKNRNTTVQNYHGFVYTYLARRNLRCPPDKQIKTFLEKCSDIPLIYDIICIDEYQDLEEDTANLLLYIAKECPNAQWVFVGDMSQKIYDKTKIDVYKDCIDKIAPDYVPVQFTKCFRISKEHADSLAAIWEKEIEGVNENCKVRYTTDFAVLLEVLDSHENKDILIVGPRYGLTPEIVNLLERHNPRKYNKTNVWTSIRDKDENTTINPDSLIVTTYDGCKGTERKVCIVIDWINTHYRVRVEKPFVDQQIITNLFCVAASRGKDTILFYTDDISPNKHFFTKADLGLVYSQSLPSYNPSSMFDFKFQEDIAKCMTYLNLEEIPQEDKTVIEVLNRDENIDLAPCIGLYQEISFFKYYDFEKAVDQYENTPINSRIKKFIRGITQMSPEQKALALAALETGLFRYVEQASWNFITEESALKLHARLKSRLDPNSKKIQVGCHIVDAGFTAIGRIDYVGTDNIPVELKFVSRLTNQHFLQAAMYSLMYKSDYCYLWNTKTNVLFKVSVNNREEFLKQVYKTITQGRKLRRS
jgi:hypothetical protein